MKYFLDSNVLIHLSNDARKAAKINRHIDRVGVENILVSTITIYELHTKLIKAKVSPANVKKLSDAIDIFDIKNFNSGAARSASKVRAELEAVGKSVGDCDQMLAGHAKFEKAVVVTNNTKDFINVHGLKIEDWLKE
jgi:tRNA(fMet)-specific endonuclease VapC